MEPAASIIRKLGGESVVSDITKTAYTAPYRWQHDKERGGTGGKIPARHISAILAYAKAKDIPLKADDFFLDDASTADARP